MASVPASWSASESSPTRARAFKRISSYAFVALGSVLYLFPFVRVLAVCPDEGVSEYGAQAILRGAIPGREFIELYAPGAYYWLALFFKLFGASVLVARGFLLAEGALTALLIFYLGRRIGGVGLFAAAFVLVMSVPFAVLNTPHYDANLFALLSLCVFTEAERALREAGKSKKVLVLLFVCGTLAGWTACIMQQKGVLFLLAFALALVSFRPGKPVGLLVTLFGGFCTPIAAGLTFYAAHHALPDLIYANFTLPASLYERLNSAPYGYPLWSFTVPTWFAAVRTAFPVPIATAFVGLLALPFVLVMVLPVVVLVMGYLRRLVALRPEWRPYWFAAFALWASELHRLDLGHLRNGVLLFALLFFTLCENHPRAWVRQIAIAVTVCTILTAVVNSIGAASRHTVLHTRRGDLLASQPDKALEFLMEHTRPGDDVLVYPYHPVYYFLADLRNPTRLAAFLYDPAAEGLFREAVRDVDKKRVQYVLWDTALAGKNMTSLFPSYREPSPDKLIVEPYLREHYHQIAFENGFHILERNQ